MSLFRFSLAAALMARLTSPAAAIPMDTVLLQGLDKITARVSQIKVPVGGTVTFGALQITARACDKHPPEEAPEAAAFLEVVEVKPDEKVTTNAPAANDPACAEHTGMQKMAPAEAAATKAFDHKPNPGETAICAVSGEKFTVEKDTKVAEYKGKWYAFCCDNCEPDFQKDPAKFAN